MTAQTGGTRTSVMICGEWGQPAGGVTKAAIIVSFHRVGRGRDDRVMRVMTAHAILLMAVRRDVDLRESRLTAQNGDVALLTQLRGGIDDHGQSRAFVGLPGTMAIFAAHGLMDRVDHGIVIVDMAGIAGYRIGIIGRDLLPFLRVVLALIKSELLKAGDRRLRDQPGGDEYEQNDNNQKPNRPDNVFHTATPTFRSFPEARGIWLRRTNA